jgi:hypothetical protein
LFEISWVFLVCAWWLLLLFHVCCNFLFLVSVCAVVKCVVVVHFLCCSYSTIAWAIPAHYGHKLPGSNSVVSADYHLPYGHKIGGDVMNIFNALGTVAFAYAGHNVVLEIQATIPSTPEKPSKSPMWRGVLVAYMVVAACYFPVSLVGYWAYGNNAKLLVDGNILTFEASPVWLVVVANFMVIVHVMGSYQV